MKCNTVYGCLTPHLCRNTGKCVQAASERATPESAGPAKVVVAESTGSGEAVRELKRLLRFCGERPGAAVCSERMEGAAAARHAIRAEIRARLRLLQPNSRDQGRAESAQP